MYGRLSNFYSKEGKGEKSVGFFEKGFQIRQGV